MHSEFERGNLKEEIKQNIAPLMCVAFSVYLSYLMQPENADDSAESLEEEATASTVSQKVSQAKVEPEPEPKDSESGKKVEAEKANKEGSECMSTDDLVSRIYSDESLAFLRDGSPDFNEGITRVLDKASDILGGSSAVRSISKVDYNWNVHCDQREVGKRQCARTVGNILGFGEGKHGYMSVTKQLVPALVAGNIERTGNPGIVFDLEDYKKGDVIVFKGGNKKTDYGHGRFSHVGIVRDILTIEGQKFIAMQHDAENLYIDLIPVNPDGEKVKDIQKKLVHPKKRQDLIDANPQLASIYEYRKDYPNYVRVAKNTDKRIRRVGRIAFAIRTSELV